MKVVKSLLISLGVALSIFATNSLWYAVIMRGFYENSQGSWMQVSREHPSIPVILLGIFALSVLMMVLYPKVQMGIKSPVLANLVFGMLIGLIYVLPSSLYYFGTCGSAITHPCSFLAGTLVSYQSHCLQQQTNPKNESLPLCVLVKLLGKEIKVKKVLYEMRIFYAELNALPP